MYIHLHNEKLCLNLFYNELFLVQLKGYVYEYYSFATLIKIIPIRFETKHISEYEFTTSYAKQSSSDISGNETGMRMKAKYSSAWKIIFLRYLTILRVWIVQLKLFINIMHYVCYHTERKRISFLCILKRYISLWINIQSMCLLVCPWFSLRPIICFQLKFIKYIVCV
jgi:hypothetical protein